MSAAGHAARSDGEPVGIDVGPVRLAGLLCIPEEARGLVLFVHGSGSGRLSPRNRAVAWSLREDGFATLLIDLLTDAEEARDRVDLSLRFDIGLLTKRVLAVIDALADDPRARSLRIALYGASTGAAAALAAAAQRPNRVHAIIARGGRPDLAASALPRVVAPTLLIVGGDDPTTLDLNQARSAACAARIASRSFQAPPTSSKSRGALERVAELTRSWMRLHLAEEWKAHVATGS